jgi:hypothetical protein
MIGAEIYNRNGKIDIDREILVRSHKGLDKGVDKAIDNR